jgi:hypothetical protein
MQRNLIRLVFVKILYINAVRTSQEIYYFYATESKRLMLIVYEHNVSFRLYKLHSDAITIGL